MALDKSTLDNLEEVQKPDLVQSKIGNIDYASKVVFVAGIAGFIYAMVTKKNKLLWTAIGAVGGGLLQKIVTSTSK